jgi:hypothetical protein
MTDDFRQLKLTQSVWRGLMPSCPGRRSVTGDRSR